MVMSIREKCTQSGEELARRIVAIIVGAGLLAGTVLLLYFELAIMLIFLTIIAGMALLFVLMGWLMGELSFCEGNKHGEE